MPSVPSARPSFLESCQDFIRAVQQEAKSYAGFRAALARSAGRIGEPSVDALFAFSSVWPKFSHLIGPSHRSTAFRVAAMSCMKTGGGDGKPHPFIEALRLCYWKRKLSSSQIDERMRKDFLLLFHGASSETVFFRHLYRRISMILHEGISIDFGKLLQDIIFLIGSSRKARQMTETQWVESYFSWQDKPAKEDVSKGKE